MDIISAAFKTSAASLKDCPKTELPEYAFIGRSNVGKSSLINMLLQRRELARTSGTPGKTITMNFFSVNEEWFVVDLPGYGYAKRSKDLRASWEKTLWNYLEKRDPLVNLFVLIDSRIEPQEKDLEFINQLGEKGIPFQIVFTKLDKLKNAEAEKNIAQFKETMLEAWEELPEIYVTSSLDKRGREEMLGAIQKMNKEFNKVLKLKNAQMR
ncbi:MAG: ribosome biogenesis GTP-binding protein YihA/YsxC [Bacteroidia bacterium]|nr:ribosome biogenesis GTP-binding protein YihA/YsxC [Bacteroidia bacterium]MCF8427640.1 ribosome biogenesis GTP-binding protein YihA/YsxC [Bacteroidia bacterium]MCF8446995.1 ribosome biogenesis GTP-binding protein YihA/YsxC [Bacteroidia bacterium]